MTKEYVHTVFLEYWRSTIFRLIFSFPFRTLCRARLILISIKVELMRYLTGRQSLICCLPFSEFSSAYRRIIYYYLLSRLLLCIRWQTTIMSTMISSPALLTRYTFCLLSCHSLFTIDNTAVAIKMRSKLNYFHSWANIFLLFYLQS